MLQTGWVAQHHRDFDLDHLHVGFDATTPDERTTWTAALAARGRPMVLTVHDLTNPHFVDQTRHRENLDVLIAAADQLITLTSSAAAQIEQQWGRRASIIPHPHVVPLRDVWPKQPSTASALVLGMHAKSLRANVDPLPVLRALDVTAKAIPNTYIQLHVHPDVLRRDDERPARLRDWLSG